MSIRINQDPMGMGGTSTLIANMSGFAQIPATEQQLVTPRQLGFFEHLPQSILDLEARAKAELPEVPELARWLRTLPSAPCEIEIYNTVYIAPQVWLRFRFGEKWAPAINLTEPAVDPKWPLPEALRTVYRLVGETNHNGFMTAGGLCAPDKGIDAWDGGTWTGHKEFYKCYETFTGDAFGFSEKGETFWYLHEVRSLKPYPNMVDFLNAYFKHLSKRTELWAG